MNVPHLKAGLYLRAGGLGISPSMKYIPQNALHQTIKTMAEGANRFNPCLSLCLAFLHLCSHIHFQLLDNGRRIKCRQNVRNLTLYGEFLHVYVSQSNY